MDRRFSILLNQIHLNEENILAELASTTIKEVKIYAETKKWHFYLSSPKRFHPDVFEIFYSKLTAAFESIAQIELDWTFEQQDDNPHTIKDYWKVILMMLSKDKPVLKSIYERGKHQIDDHQLKVHLASKQEAEILNSQYKELLEKQFSKLGFVDITIQFIFDEHLFEEQREIREQRKFEEDEKNRKIAHELNQKKLIATASKEIFLEENDLKPIGKDISKDEITPIIDLPENHYRQVIEGYVFSKEIKEIKNGQIMLLKITDYTSSVTLRVLSGRSIKVEQFSLYKQGDWIKAEGDYSFNTFTNDFEFHPKSIRLISKSKRYDLASDDKKRVELHAHSNMSQMDATNQVEDLIKQAAEWGHPAIAITDHGAVQAFPEAYLAGKKHNIKVLYGMEAYVVNDGEPIAYFPQAIELASATYVVFDVETTGLSSIYDSIIELAAVKMKDGQITDIFEAFINPGHPLSAFTTELTGITDTMLADAPSEEEVLKKFWDFSQGCILVAHNASFDIGFISQGYLRVGLGSCELPVIDTLELSRLVNPHLKSHRLNNLARYYGINLEQHHRAVYDSETTGFLLMKLLDQAREQFQMVSHLDLNNQMGKGDDYKNARPFHVTVLAKNQQGLKDLFKIVSESNVNYFYRVPRVPRRLLAKYRDNLLIGSACSEGELFVTMMQKGYEEAKELVDFYDYIEIQPPSVYQPLIQQQQIRSSDDLMNIIQNLIYLGNESNKLVVATGNVHYINENDAIYREILIKSLKANANRQIFLPQVHFRTTDEMLKEFDFLGDEKAQELVVTNPNLIAESIEDIEVIKKELFTPNITGSDAEIRKLSYDKAYEMYGNPLPDIVEARIEKELNSIISNGFAVIYLIAQKLVKKSMDDGYLVGSRGSVGSSLVATLTGITEVNPLAPHYYCPTCHYSEFFQNGEVGSGYDLPSKQCPHCHKDLLREGQDIPFETFLGFYGDKVPDIDLNFSGEYQPRAHAYTKVLFGEDHVFRAGTISTVAEKTAFGYVKGYIENTGKQVTNTEKERLAKGLEGVKRTTGQHPGGIIVIPDYMDVYDFTPVQYPADDNSAEWQTTHFDFHSIHDNVLKLDILGHDDPTMIRKLQDLSGIDPRSIPFNDPAVMSLFSSPKALGVTPEQIFSSTGTLGVPEFGTNFVRGMLADTHPSTFAELLQISGLSHGTDVWLGNAQDLIINKVTTLAKVIGCRDDIMVTLMQYGLEDGLAFNIMEGVRKGKGISQENQEIMRHHQVPEWYIDSCLKIKYMFPKAHAAAYIMMALRVAYFKVHYPLFYYAAYFSVRAADFDLVAMVNGKESLKKRLKDIMGMGFGMSVKDKSLLTVLEIANEMLERGFKFQKVSIDKSDAENFIIEGDTLIPPFRAIPGLGANVAQQIIRARNEAPFLSKEDLQKRGKVSKTIIEYLIEQDVINHLPDKDQLSLF